MPRNVEIKARLTDASVPMRLAAELAGNEGQLIRQEDIFFHGREGRLKLRILAPDHGELIFYHRPDQAGPKTSTYAISVTSEPAQLRQVLALSLGERAVVRKTRRLFLVGRTRVHLDAVEGLGEFLELEVVMADGEDLAAGEQEAAALMARLQVTPSALIEGAYVDLLAAADHPDDAGSR